MARTKYINKKESTTTTSQNKWKSSTLLDQGYFKIIPSGIVKFKGEKDYLSTKSISWDKIKKIESKITLNSRPSRANMQPIQNSVWFAKMKNTIKVYYFDNTNADETNRFILSTGFLGVACNDTIIPNFLKYVFLSQKFNSIKDSLTKGSTQQAINNSALEQITIPIPPLDDQREIAYILQRIEDAIEFQNKIITTVKMLKKAVMHKLFTEGIEHKGFKNTEIGKIPKNWESGRIKDFCEILTGGTPKTEKIDYWNPQEIPWIKSGEVRGYKVTSVNTFISKNGLENSNARWLPKNSVLIALAGRGRTRGTTAMLEVSCTCNQSVACLNPNKQINYVYLHYYLSNLYKYIRNLTGDEDRSGLNKQIIGNIPLIFPDIKTQREIASILSSIDTKIQIEQKQRFVLKSLFKTLSENLLSGEIRTNKLGVPKHVNR
jgi:type I restriction enzyme S subunit